MDKLVLRGVFSRYGTHMIAFTKIIQRYYGTPLRQIGYADPSDVCASSGLESTSASVVNPPVGE